MSLELFEEKITPKLAWKKVDDIPGFPLKNFGEVKENLKNNNYAVGIQFSAANELAKWLYGKGHTIFFTILASTPILTSILSLIVAFLTRNYWLLFGVVLGFVGSFLSNPYNPSKNSVKPIVGILFFLSLYGIWKYNLTLAFLPATFVVPFFINGYVYEMNRNKLEKVAVNSEKVFIYLYQVKALGLRENSSGKSFWNY